MSATKQPTVRVTRRTHQALQELTKQTGQSMPTIIEKAIDDYQREQILREANEQWERILADPVARAKAEAEDALMDQTAGDGLEDWPW